jgi:hypothetical protein
MHTRTGCHTKFVISESISLGNLKVCSATLWQDLSRSRILVEAAKPKLGAWELVTSLVYHVMNGAGILSQHVH